MFERCTAPDHVLAVRLYDDVSLDDMARYKALFDDMLTHQNHIGLCVDFTGLSDVSADALLLGTQADFEFLTHVAQFTRLAIISDKKWPRIVIKGMQTILPMVETRLFTPDQGDAAIAWASAHPKITGAREPAFQLLPPPGDHVMAFALQGILSPDDMPRIRDSFQDFTKNHDRVRLLARMTDFRGIDPTCILNRELIATKLALLPRLERYAIIGAPAWIAAIMTAVRPLIPGVDIRLFPPEQEDQAWAWISADQAS